MNFLGGRIAVRHGDDLIGICLAVLDAKSGEQIGCRYTLLKIRCYSNTFWGAPANV